MSLLTDQIKAELADLNARKAELQTQLNDALMVSEYFKAIIGNPNALNVASVSPYPQAIVALLPAEEASKFRALMNVVTGPMSATNDAFHQASYVTLAKARLDAYQIKISDLKGRINIINQEINQIFAEHPTEAAQAQAEISGTWKYWLIAVVVLIIAYIIYKKYGRK